MEVIVAAFNPWSNGAEWSAGIPPEIHPPDAEVLALLLDEVKRREMVVVEVGSWVGNGSTRVIVEAIRPAAGALYCVDTWAGSDNVPHHLQYRERGDDLFGVFADNVRNYGGQEVVRPLRMPSGAASKLFADDSLDLVFIDGNHGYSHARQDVLAWLPKVRRGGILCGHDCDASYPDLVPELRQAIEAHCEEDVFTNERLPGPPAFHAGVVKAVHEALGGKAKLWFKIKGSTIWSYRKGGMPARLAALLCKHAPLLWGRSRRTTGPEQTPWPAARVLHPSPPKRGEGLGV